MPKLTLAQTIITAAPSQELLWQAEAAQAQENRKPLAERDYSHAIELFTQSANAGHPDAMYELGKLHIFLNQQEIGQEWVKKSADSGSPRGQMEYALNIINTNDGCAPALSYLLKSAEHYNPANVALGNYYSDGKCTPQDPQKIFHYYEIAAKNGDGACQRILGRYYFHGIGVSADIIQAWAWIALASHHYTQLEFKQKAIDDLGSIQAQMTASQIRRAKREATRICHQNAGACVNFGADTIF